MLGKYTNLDDFAYEIIRPVLGDQVNPLDLISIAEEAAAFDGHYYTARRDLTAEEFAAIVEKHAGAEACALC